MSTLLVGPWTGEFGHEIGVWQANARERARAYDHVIVGCVETSRDLYRDFANEFRIIPPDNNTSGLGRCDGSHVALIRQFAMEAHVKRIDWMKPERLKPCPEGFIRFGVHDPSLAFDVVIHAREMLKGTRGGDRRRCWRPEAWEALGAKLAERGLTVACIGLEDAASRIPVAADFRGCPLWLTMGLLASSRCLVGQTSGPIHLGILCGCPTVVWTDTNHRSGYTGRTNVDHLIHDWNPFNTPVTIFHGWDPDIDDILRGVAATHAKHPSAREADGPRHAMVAGPVQ